jgi:glycosyltransferase involved in cell wall biosynthesis
MSKNPPLISVIMPVFNTPEDFLRAAINSILNQTHKNLELIVIDGSPNNINKKSISLYAQKDKRARYIRQSKKKGLPVALNQAVLACRGDYIARMDADDIAEPKRLEKQVKYLINNKLDICGCFVKTMKSHGQDRLLTYPCTHKKIVGAMAYSQPIPHPTWLVKKSFYKKFKYNENYREAEDYELLMRALPSVKAGNLPEHLLKYRIHENSASLANLKKLEWRTIRIRLRGIFVYKSIPYWKIVYLIIPLIAFLTPIKLKKYFWK